MEHSDIYIPRDRSQTLHSANLQETPHEEVFEAIIRIAKRLFDAPIVSVSVIDANRQLFQSSSGPYPQGQTGHTAVSGHALVEDDNDPVIIPDTLEDSRTEDNPLVKDEPFARFYGSFPVKAPDGHYVGTVCLIDQSPREYDQADVEALEDLALIASREIGSRELSEVDPLTQIQNKRGFLLLAQSKLSLCQREQLPASLIHFDLESFEPITEQCGQNEGDRVLALFAQELQNLFRQSDVAARLRGSQFALLLVNCSNQSAQICIERITRAIDQYNDTSEAACPIAFSSGVAEYEPSRHSDVDALIADAESVRLPAFDTERPVSTTQSPSRPSIPDDCGESL